MVIRAVMNYLGSTATRNMICNTLVPILVQPLTEDQHTLRAYTYKLTQLAFSTTRACPRHSPSTNPLPLNRSTRLLPLHPTAPPNTTQPPTAMPSESKTWTTSCTPLSVSDDDDVNAVCSHAPRPSEIKQGFRV